MAIAHPLNLTVIETNQEMPGGASKPWLCTAVDDTGTEYSVVVKFQIPKIGVGIPNLGKTSLACELLFAIIARHLGFSVPDFAVVTISKEFAESINDTSNKNHFLTNVGENFGSVFCPGMMDYPQNTYTPRNTYHKLAEIYTFDNVILNGDRQQDKPNLLYNNDVFLLIDHGLAFALSFKDDKAITLPEQYMRAHVSYTKIRKKNVSPANIINRWRKKIDKTFLDTCIGFIPKTWNENRFDFSLITDKVYLRTKNLNFIKLEIIRLLN